MYYTKEQIRIGAEKAFIMDLIVNKFPKGIVSYVADSFSLWDVIVKILPTLKEEILARDGKLVIRPDSGDPVDILCGVGIKYEELKYIPEGEILPSYFEDYLLEEVQENTPHGEHGDVEYSQTYIVRGKLYRATIHNISWNRYDKQYYYIDMYEKAKITLEELEWKPSDKGVVELLWDIFGGTVNEQGYKVLDSHIGVIYGDSITLDRQIEIYKRLEAKGFACTNIVLGVGSYTHQMNTRDTLGFAAKGSWFEIEKNGEKIEYSIYKDPVTDDGTKKSLKGLLQVVNNNPDCQGGDILFNKKDNFVVNTECTQEQESGGILQTIYENGEFYNQTTLTEIRSRIQKLI